MAPSLAPALGELERALALLAPRFPMPELLLDRPPLITIQSGRQGRRRLLGWTSPACWRHAATAETVTEIGLAAEDLARSRVDCLATLLHETVHVYNHLLARPDCSADQYHRESFRDLALQVGLKVEFLGRRLGWAKTEPSDELAAELASLPIDDEAFSLYRCPSASPQRARDSRLTRWTCGCTIARATFLVATCDRCGRCFYRAS
jgi:hypothetical protein